MVRPLTNIHNLFSIKVWIPDNTPTPKFPVSPQPSASRRERAFSTA